MIDLLISKFVQICSLIFWETFTKALFIIAGGFMSVFLRGKYFHKSNIHISSGGMNEGKKVGREVNQS